MALERCEVCGNPDVTYAAFSGGREYWCGTCESNHPYPEAELPPRLKLLRAGRHAELRELMHRELTDPPEGAAAIRAYYQWLRSNDEIETDEGDDVTSERERTESVGDGR